MSSRLNGTHTDQVRIGVITALLRTGAHVDHASSLLLLLTLVFVLPMPFERMAIVAFAGFLVAIAQKYFAWRVALDVELFGVLQQFPAQPSTFHAFDTALSSCLGRDLPSAGKNLEHRWRGARSLLRAQIIAFMAQTVCAGTLFFL
jgi:hypothetical protein